MPQDVKLKIHGTQKHGEEENDDVEVVCIGKMYDSDGFMCITYDEVIEGEPNGLVETATNMVKIRDDQVEVIKNGQMKSHLIFVPNQATFSYYSTPFGELEVSVHTKKLEKTEQEKGFRLVIQYDLDLNHNFISSCMVDIEVEK